MLRVAVDTRAVVARLLLDRPIPQGDELHGLWLLLLG